MTDNQLYLCRLENVRLNDVIFELQAKVKKHEDGKLDASDYEWKQRSMNVKLGHAKRRVSDLEDAIDAWLAGDIGENALVAVRREAKTNARRREDTHSVHADNLVFLHDDEPDMEVDVFEPIRDIIAEKRAEAGLPTWDEQGAA